MREKFIFYIRHSINDLRVNRQRSLFALLCIAAGVAAIVSLQTLSYMMNKTLTESLQETNRGDIQIIPSESWGEYIIELDEESMFGGSTVFTQAGIEHIQLWLDEHYPGSVITYRQALKGFGIGWSVGIPERDTEQPLVFNFLVDADVYPLYGTVETEGGKRLADMLIEPTDVVLSENLADMLEAEVGDSFRIAGASQDFTVRGIVPADTEAGLQNAHIHVLGYYYLDVSAIDFFEGMTLDEAVTLYVQLGDPSQIDQAEEDLEKLSRSDAFFLVTTTQIKQLNSVVSDVIDNLVIIMGLVSLLIGGIGIVNTMIVIVSRRTTEVAVLKTLGLEPHEVIQLFLVEAILMGIIGSLLGILGGWVLAYAVKGVAENFLGQHLSFTIASSPAINGFIVGIIITTIFGFLPTLAAGQIRPANVLRPGDEVIPRAGRLSAFVAMVIMVLILSLVTQGLLGTLLHDVEVPYIGITIQHITAALGLIYGLAIAIPVIVSGVLSMRERRRGRSWALYQLYWLGLLIGLPVLGALFGYNVPAMLVITITIALLGYLYITLWLVIWAVGGGRAQDIWPGILVLLFPVFWPLIPVLIVLIIPTWILGWLIQRYTFIDFKVAMRSMLATKARGAATLLALVVGIFALSMITMLVDTITSAIELQLQNTLGGNVMVISVGGRETNDKIIQVLEENQEYVRSFSNMTEYETRLVSYQDVSAERDFSTAQRRSIGDMFEMISGRDLASNLPDVTFLSGRNLDPTLDHAANAEGYWPVVVTRYNDIPLPDNIEIETGDRFTVLVGEERQRVKFQIVGVAEVSVQVGESQLYAPRESFGDQKAEATFVVADVEKDHIRDVRRALAKIPGVFALETRLLNDFINRMVDQFTSFPLLVAALALFTGGVVIANSVALSTLERRREIGIMKALGLQRMRVLGMLLLENGLMGIVGGLIGVGIGFVGLVLLLTFGFKGELGDVIPYTVAFLLMGLCILISLVAAIFSVWGASGEKPLNVLRYE